MTKVTLDDVLRAKLQNLEQPLELCDESGETGGFFLSLAEFEQIISDWAKDRYPAEEVERRWNEPPGRTTAEVLARLQQP